MPMVSKDFEQVIKFRQALHSGTLIRLPIVEVSIIAPSGKKRNIPLLFDTGASTTMLSAKLYSLLELQSWNQGTPCNITNASPVLAQGYQYQASMEIFGKVIACPVILLQLPHNPLYQGLLGRNTIFDEFGFGFWERTQDLYITANP
ncbi:MAG: hypothetical protein ABSA09_11290 [Desulfobaccales bacterium]|jgi:hypothetical protein